MTKIEYASSKCTKTAFSPERFSRKEVYGVPQRSTGEVHADSIKSEETPHLNLVEETV